MKKVTTQLFVVFLLSFLIILTSVNKAVAQSEADGAALESVIQTVKQSLKEAQSNNVEGFPPLKKVKIDLNTVITRGTGAKINFLIFSIGSRKETEQASKLSLEMNPPTTVTGTTSASIDNLQTTLAKAINLAKDAVLKSNEVEAQPILITNNVTIEIKFAVKYSGSAGAKVEILPIGIEADGKIDKNKIHTITLVFNN